MPDNLPLEWAVALIVLTATLPVLKDMAMWLFNRATHRIEVVAEATNDIAQASKTAAERESIWQKNYENVVQTLFGRDREIAELNKRVAALEVFQIEYEREKQARINAEADLENERELRIEVEEEFAIAKDKWRLEKKSLEEQICELRDQLNALEVKMSRLESVQKSHTQELPLIVTENKEHGNTNVG